MGSSGDYKKDWDLIMQELEAKELAAKQSAANDVLDYVLKITSRKDVQRLFELCTPEERLELVRSAVQKKFPTTAVQSTTGDN